MRSLAIDLDWTVLGPLILFVLVVLARFVREHRAAVSSGNRPEGDNFKGLAGLSIGALVVLCTTLFAPDKFKVFIGYQLWGLLAAVSCLAVFGSIAAAWHFAKNLEFVKVGICLVAMLMAASSAEHFYHQRFNSHRIVCPDCGDDDEPDEDGRMLWRDSFRGETMNPERIVYGRHVRRFCTYNAQQGEG